MTFITEAYMFSSGFLVGASMMGVASVLLGVLAYVGVRRWREDREARVRRERERQHTQNLRAECERLMRAEKARSESAYWWCFESEDEIGAWCQITNEAIRLAEQRANERREAA